jgi:uncharacterized integral membrane protein
VVLLLLVIVFMVQNAAITEIKFLMWEIDIPRSFVVFMTFLIGVLVGWFMRAMYRLSRTG